MLNTSVHALLLWIDSKSHTQTLNNLFYALDCQDTMFATCCCLTS